MPKRLLEVYEVVERIALMFYVLLYDDSITEDLFYCAQAWSEICLLIQPAVPQSRSSSAVLLNNQLRELFTTTVRVRQGC